MVLNLFSKDKCKTYAFKLFFSKIRSKLMNFFKNQVKSQKKNPKRWCVTYKSGRHTILLKNIKIHKGYYDKNIVKRGVTSNKIE